MASITTLMIIITKPHATEQQVDHIVERVTQWGLRARSVAVNRV